MKTSSQHNTVLVLIQVIVICQFVVINIYGIEKINKYEIIHFKITER